MARPVLKKTEKALAMLDKFHPKYPNRHYTVFEAAAKHGVGLTTMYRHIKKQEAAAAMAAQQIEGDDMSNRNKEQQK